MRIALLGYGKMGKIIDRKASEKGHEVVLRVDLNGPDSLDDIHADQVDVAIEFTNPEIAPIHIAHCIEGGIPIVVGSTGWYDQYEALSQLCLDRQASLFTATNFSIGVNIFFAVNRFLAKQMSGIPGYSPTMEETHHVHKLDAPSGTAITLAEGILKHLPRTSEWVMGDEKVREDQLPIVSHRIDEVPGTHLVQYRSTVDSIEIKHTAHSREGFAEGTIVAAEWLLGKQGVFGMEDLLGI
ncbi:MAG: 4-hydroxy-tetrahydrodipicolinate reductase [Saprospiraceae bacterium]|nr:4-hydroxy-tetrahydrodipicolinate reductase [Saprospiraceae bacterium]